MLPIGQPVSKVDLEAGKEVFSDDDDLLASLDPALADGEGFDDGTSFHQSG